MAKCRTWRGLREERRFVRMKATKVKAVVIYGVMVVLLCLTAVLLFRLEHLEQRRPGAPAAGLSKRNVRYRR